MKKQLRRLIVFASALGLMMALNVGAAFADHPGEPFVDANAFGGHHHLAAAQTPGSAPVGTALGFVPGGPQTHPGLINMSDSAVAGIAHNPNCPLHYL